MMFKCKRHEQEVPTSYPKTSTFPTFPHMYSTFDYSYFLRNLQTATACTNASQWSAHRPAGVSHSASHLSPTYPVIDKHCPLQACSQMCYNIQPSYNDDKDDSMNRVVVPLPSEVEGEPLDILPKSLLTKCKSGHICVFCGKFYSRKYGLKIHLRTHTGYKPLKCKICLRPFGDPSNLNKHVRLHAEGETPYRCEFCNKVLVRRRDLDRHIRSRHPEVMESSDVGNAVKQEDTDDDIIVT